MSTSVTAPPPEQGQYVRLRHKIWSVNRVDQSKGKETGTVHKVSLECLTDDSLGRQIDVIWEREIAPLVLESTSLPSPKILDPPEMLEAYLSALRWSSISRAQGDVLQAPFRGGIQIEPYQLVPVVRATKMPEVRLLIADDVGLGKTIEAGLIAQELIHTHRATRIIVVCPAHLKTKWVDEMAEKFGLEFRIIERDTILQMRREFGPTINPWARRWCMNRRRSHASIGSEFRSIMESEGVTQWPHGSRAKSIVNTRRNTESGTGGSTSAASGAVAMSPSG